MQVAGTGKRKTPRTILDYRATRVPDDRPPTRPRHDHRLCFLRPFLDPQNAEHAELRRGVAHHEPEMTLATRVRVGQDEVVPERGRTANPVVLAQAVEVAVLPKVFSQVL